MKIENFWETRLSKFLKIVQASNKFKLKNDRYQFNPYQDNSGTIVSITFNGFIVIASDTRLVSGYSIPDRRVERIIKISENIILATAGMQSDIFRLQENLKNRISRSFLEKNLSCSIDSCASLLSSILYSRRFFPFYCFNLLSGLNLNGSARNFGFDAIGSYENSTSASIGSGQKIIQPLLDSSFPENFRIYNKMSNTIDGAVSLMKHFFLAASERGTSIGDGLQIFVITKDGILLENSIIKPD